mmetsp:Transcript_37409/g.82043  ORF Transcript_37409/g.82043 Transcript_37409/m.82043 type:complete len:488 (+) Transcript_37409:112-1575(+)|eukprot:CAMPEP_0170601342 /NCGR_PEP_ID=MMETSP0224-20130122/17808_1 /TAXON_ID=285029 /ORGANISM="Togula jolla, Strain CCCM 725" /LENGTH=487 /DNA_ID=CAMNT_0010926111 /DNA_START=84 /DNA_END=1547 /DNA_ORIENTATION=+
MTSFYMAAVVMLSGASAVSMLRGRDSEAAAISAASIPDGWALTDVCKACSNGKWMGLGYTLQQCAEANSNASYLIYKPMTGYCGHVLQGCTVFAGGYTCSKCTDEYGSCSGDVGYIFARGEAPQFSLENSLGATGLRSVAMAPCLIEESRVAAPFVEAWRKSCPAGLVQVDDGSEGCIMTRGSDRAMMTLVEHTIDNICQDEGPISQSAPRAFKVIGKAKERNATRNLFVIRPKNACMQGERCPVVVYLHGHDEHVDKLVGVDGPEAEEQAWEMASKAGLMRYAHQDDCGETLKSVLIFPQLLKGESWAEDGSELLEDFVLPILKRHHDSPEEGYWNMNEVSIVGYSEGADGVIHAAKEHPDVFRLAIAAAARPPQTSSDQVADVHLMQESGCVANGGVNLLRTPPPSSYKLQLVVTTFGQMDILSTAKDDMQAVIQDLGSSGVTAPLHARVYVGAGHIHWDNVFNKWPVLHEVLWRGDYSALKRIS